MVGIRFICPDKVIRSAGEGWKRSCFTGVDFSWLHANKDLRNLDADGSLSTVIESYFKTASQKFGPQHMDLFHRWVFRNATGAPILVTPCITSLQVTSVLCAICKLVVQEDSSHTLSRFLQQCVDKFSPTSVKRSEREAATARLAPPPDRPSLAAAEGNGSEGINGADTAADGSPTPVAGGGGDGEGVASPRGRSQPSAGPLRDISTPREGEPSMQLVMQQMTAMMSRMETMETAFTKKFSELDKRQVSLPDPTQKSHAPDAAPAPSASRNDPRASAGLDLAAFDDQGDGSARSHAHMQAGARRGGGGGGWESGNEHAFRPSHRDQGRPRLHEVIGHPQCWRDYVDPGTPGDDERWTLLEGQLKFKFRDLDPAKQKFLGRLLPVARESSLGTTPEALDLVNEQLYGVFCTMEIAVKESWSEAEEFERLLGRQDTEDPRFQKLREKAHRESDRREKRSGGRRNRDHDRSQNYRERNSSSRKGFRPVESPKGSSSPTSASTSSRTGAAKNARARPPTKKRH